LQTPAGDQAAASKAETAASGGQCLSRRLLSKHEEASPFPGLPTRLFWL